MTATSTSNALRTAPIELVVSDLDGTLWDGAGVIHERALGAVHDLAAAGVDLLIATGRRTRSAASALAAYGLTPPAVLLGGALGVDLATGAEFHRHAFDPDDAVTVLDAYLAEGLEPVVYVEQSGTETFVGPDPSTHPAHVAGLGRWARRVDDLRTVVAEHPVLNFGVCGVDRAALERVERAVCDVGRPALHDDLTFGGNTLMVAPRGLSKWDGVLTYCDQRGLDPARVLAIGDGPNDLELLEHAAIACVVEDGCAEALALAHHVVPSHTLGGWADVLDLVR